MFKKALSLILVAMMVFSLVATLASCGGPSGKYSRKDTVAGIEVESYYEFDGDKVSFSVAGVEVSEATYEINDGKIKISYKLGPISYNPEYDYELSGKTLKINNIEYVKD